jgi:hypothetical protein
MSKRLNRLAVGKGVDDGGPTRRRATTVAQLGRLVLETTPANSRLFVYMIGNYLHRIERERRKLYFGDLDLAVVAELIGTAGVEPGCAMPLSASGTKLSPVSSASRDNAA